LTTRRSRRVLKTEVDTTPGEGEPSRREQRAAPHNQWIWSVDTKREYTDTEKYQVKVMFCKLYYEQAHMGYAAHMCGVSLQTIDDWLAADPVFQKMINNVRRAFNDDADARLIRNLRNEDLDPRAQNTAAFGVKNTFDPEFRTGKRTGGSVVVNVVLGPDPDRPPKRLPAQSGTEIEVIDPDDER
jgi:hypothetical protein